METVGDGSRQRDALPPFSYLDFDKVKREGTHYHQRHPSLAALSMPSTAPISPTSMYSGPPPPYSNPLTSTVSSVPSFSGLISPAESRRTSGDDKEPLHPQKQRQSLPSLHEALSGEPPLPYSTPASSAIPPQSNPPSSVVSPTTPIPRSYPPGNPQLGHPGQRSQSQGSSLSFSTTNHHSQQGHSAQSAYNHQDLSNAAPSNYSRNHSLPSLPSLRPVHQGSQSQQTSPQYEPGSTSASSMNSQYSYGNYNPQYSGSSQTSAGPTGGYQPPSSFGTSGGYSPRAEPTYARKVDNRQVEEARAFGIVKAAEGEKYGQHVKRHLDIFDLEASLSEILARTHTVYNFSSHYKGRAHDSQRSSGPSPTMPSVSECDEMLNHQKRITETLMHMRELIAMQQNAIADQRASESGYKSSTEYDMDDAGLYHDDGKSNGMMGPDPKKRRGRAAPPGRCHSCNRAETPEWRRGPDGARTLCNACGLHYAKLTRKMGSKQSLGGSSLRPKSMAPGSPRP